MGNLDIRTSSTTVLGSPTAVSLGGRVSNSAPSTTKHGFWDAVTEAQNDSGYTDYRCVFIWNNTAFTWNNVEVILSNKGGGAAVTVALSSVAKADKDTLNVTAIGSETTAPSVSGSYASRVTVGTLTPDQAKAVWLKRVVEAGADETFNDTVDIIASGIEVVT